MCIRDRANSFTASASVYPIIKVSIFSLIAPSCKSDANVLSNLMLTTTSMFAGKLVRYIAMLWALQGAISMMNY